MDFKQLFGLMRQGDENAIIICEECMNVWAAAIVSYIHAYDPEVVVLGGGIMRSADIILPYINKWVEDRADSYRPGAYCAFRIRRQCRFIGIELLFDKCKEEKK